jgi:hypothetical protein
MVGFMPKVTQKKWAGYPALRDSSRTQRGGRMKTATNQPDPISNRKQALPIKVFCTPVERQTITNSAYQCGLSVSHYLRAIALGMDNTPYHKSQPNRRADQNQSRVRPYYRVIKTAPKPNRNHPHGQQGFVQGDSIQSYPRNKG